MYILNKSGETIQIKRRFGFAYRLKRRTIIFDKDEISTSFYKINLQEEHV